MSEACQILHRVFNALPRLDANYSEQTIPRNGIYILFEKGETAHGTDRIVRIGTHTGQDNLRQRLKEHLFTPNKDRSIFRKHIGRCFLNKNNDPFLARWDLDLTNRENRLRYKNQINQKKLIETENAVTSYMQEKFSFVVFAEPIKSKRCDLETQLIATVAQCEDCHPSPSWLGNHHPNPAIKKSGLWNVQGLTKTPLTTSQAKDLAATLTD